MKDKSEVERYRQRVKQILEKLEDVKRLATIGDRTTIDGCFVGTLTVIESLYGSDSPQAKALMESRKAYTRTARSTQFELASLGHSIRGILLNILEEIEHGLIRRVAAEAAG